MSFLRLIPFILLAVLTAAAPAASAEKNIRAGVASMITPVSAVRYYQQVVDYLGTKLGTPVEMVHRTTYDEIDVMLRQGEVDVAFICSSPYVINHEEFAVELLVAPEVEGKVQYHSNIIVHKDSEVRSFKELRDKSFVFVDPKSNSGKLYPTYLLARMDETPESFFSHFLFSYSHNKSVEIVAKKRAEAAAVDSIVYDYMVASGSPYVAQTRVIHRSPPFGMPPVVVPAHIAPSLRESLRHIFLTMHEDEAGQKILQAMRIDRFVEVSDNSYDSIRAMRAFIHNNASVLAAKPKAPEPSEQQIVWLGVLPRDNPVIAYERYQPLADYLTKATGLQVELHLEKTYREVVDSLGNGRIGLALLGPLTYLDARKRFDASPIAKSRTARGETFFRSVIVTDVHRNLQELSQLVDGKFAFSALWSTSGNLIPRYMLAWAGIHLDDLGEHRHYNYQDTVAKKIIGREVDAGAMRLSAAERYLPYGLKIIATSEPIPTGPVVVSPHLPYEIMRRLQKALLSLATDNAGKAVLEKLDPDLQGGFVPASDADYAGIRQMINDVPNSCGKGCHPQLSF